MPDYDRDGKINDNDRGHVTQKNPWRFWINDDDDKSTGVNGISNGKDGLDDMPGQNEDNNDLEVNGIRDLVDFFPLYFDFELAIKILPLSDYSYRLSQEDSALSIIVNTGLKYNTVNNDDMSGAYLFDLNVSNKFRETKIFKIGPRAGTPYILDNEINNIQNGESNIFLFEGRKPSNKPLILEIINRLDNSVVLTYSFPLEICNAQEMYSHKNFRSIGGGTGGAADSIASKKPSCMTEDNKTLVWLHGYKVDGDAATATFAEVFKRLFHSGYNGNFYGVSWYGDPPTILFKHYHQAVVNAFNFAGTFANFVNGLPGIKSIAAHSLGNMVAGVAIHDDNLNVQNYFAINAAVALEAYGLTTRADSMIMVKDWKDYVDYDAGLDKLFASEWHTLFDASDNRSQLTWKHRLSKVIEANVYNFYSLTEDVLCEYEGDNLIFDTDWFNVKINSFVKQEKFKGRRSELISNIAGAASKYAGWGFNFDGGEFPSGWYKDGETLETYRRYNPAEAKAEIIDNNIKILKSKPFFLAEPAELFDSVTGSEFVMKPVGETSLNNYYNGNDVGSVLVRDWLLAEAIPATTLPMGANHNDFIIEDKNFDMSTARFMSNEGLWPEDRFRKEVKQWWHSDYKDLSYQHTHKFYDKIVDLSK